ncbi:MAG: DUF4982 domain-containing protein [Clostridia bacterium]|nr:DUF4982 domain-containing protein [Clostridia bacterium]
MLWNDGWFFTLLPAGSTYADLRRAALRPVILPHDWLIENTDDLYRSGDGWYVKNLPYHQADHRDEKLYLAFDGVYMDADVLVNGQVALTHRYGYTSFRVPLTERLTEGDNQIAVHVRYQSPNSRWYSGAGIYRDVHLEALPDSHMIPDGFSVNTEWQEDHWLLRVEAEISGAGEESPRAMLLNDAGDVLAEGVMRREKDRAALCLPVYGVEAWSPDHPALYRLKLTFGNQCEALRVGFRQVTFTCDRGLILNGTHVKLHGVCMHHDLGALGAAFHAPAAERQLRLMKAMGVNAVRTAHNPPARQFLDLCDRLGLLVIDEAYDMWEMPKTPYDNARFFPDTWKQTVAEWVRRDRCHPAVILWSIGNEIYDMHASERGQMWTRLLMEEVRRHDDRHAAVTFGSNYMPWEGAQRCADIVKLPGYNYAEKYYAAHHAAHPNWVIYGSETGSHLQSRGVYHFPMNANILSEEDLQCSSLLNSMTSWGTQNLPAMLVDDAATPYSLGQFIWAGIDYLGEPTPYHTRNCYFGQADTACFPKDSYYFYQAMWTDAPMIHIGMIWDWNEGQLIDVPVMTNGAYAELFLNGQSLGRKRVDRKNATLCLPRWSVVYEPGTLVACAYDEQGALIAQEEKRAFGEGKRIRLCAATTVLKAGCGDMAFVEVSVVDDRGATVENAVNRVHAEVSGPGVLLGMDNGDSTDTDPYQTDSRRLFAGRLLLMIGAQEVGQIRVRVWGKGLEEAALTLEVQEEQTGEKRAFNELCRAYAGEDDLFIRRIDLKLLGDDLLEPGHEATRFQVNTLPENADPQALSFRVTNDEGVEVPYAHAEWINGELLVTACGDGEMYVRATACNGYPHPRIISIQGITAQGFGPVGLHPYTLVAGALSDIRQGEITPGNEKGVAFARDGESAVAFSHVDFGPVGSDEITLPIFALDDKLYRITLWDGVPHAGGQVLAVLPYQKPSQWNVYQAETYRLPKVLTGVHTIGFSTDQKVHLKGFFFTPQRRTDRYIRALDADQLYGDSFVKDQDAVRGIGNNVTLAFPHMEFPAAGPATLLLEGETPLPVNTVTVRITSETGEETTSLCAFQKSEGKSSQRFRVSVPAGMCTVAFIFLPGSQFEFYGFRFLKEE